MPSWAWLFWPALPRCGTREIYLLSLSAAFAFALWAFHPQPGPEALNALDQAVFLMAFLLCISLIQEAALTSRSVADLGHYLAQQPGGRRFIGLYTGTMSMAVVFNVGTLSLLAPLIIRGGSRGAR